MTVCCSTPPLPTPAPQLQDSPLGVFIFFLLWWVRWLFYEWISFINSSPAHAARSWVTTTSAPGHGAGRVLRRRGNLLVGTHTVLKHPGAISLSHCLGGSGPSKELASRFLCSPMSSSSNVVSFRRGSLWEAQIKALTRAPPCGHGGRFEKWDQIFLCPRPEKAARSRQPLIHLETFSIIFNCLFLLFFQKNYLYILITVVNLVNMLILMENYVILL